jgi:hypothetical protein
VVSLSSPHPGATRERMRRAGNPDTTVRIGCP